MATSRFWHGFTDMSVAKNADPFIVERGDGAYLYDQQGRRYLDGSAGLWYCNVGHGRAEIADAARTQMEKLEAYSTFGDYSNAPAEELAHRLAGWAPVNDGVVFFTSGGSDSNESAIKLVRRYWVLRNEPQRTVIVSRRQAYHGGHIATTAIGGIAVDRDGFGELLPDTVQIEWDSVEALERTIATVGAERIAAFIFEPIIAAGGVHFPPEGYLQGVAAVCRRHGIVLIADEVVTGFGRAGDWFACRRFGVEPDIVVCAKGLTSGYFPLGAMIVGARLSAPFYDGTAGPFNHGYTWSGHATGAAVALANLDILEREDLAGNVRRLELHLPQYMAPLADHPLIAEVRTGPALMAAVEFTAEARDRFPGLPGKVAAAMRGEGVLTRSLVDGQIQFSPPLVIDRDDVTTFVNAALGAIDTVTSAG